MRRQIALASTTALSLIFLVAASPATAGKTRRLVGAFEDEPGSSVSMTVKLNNKNRPKFVKDIVFSGLNLLCDDDESSIPVPRTSGPVELPRLRVSYDGYGKIFKDLDADLSHFGFSGELLKKGKQSVGKVETYSGTRCSVLAYFLVKKE
jgi:hypothetical protein